VNKSNKHRKVKFWLLTISVIILSSCIEEYWPDLKNGSDNLLVVDGMISNAPGPYTVKLSRTSSIQNPEFIPVKNAMVYIIDESGTQELLNEISEGVYQTSENGILGVIGQKYKLYIRVSGKAYESDFQEILDPVRVASVNYQQDYQIVEPGSNEEVVGYQFYVSTKMAMNEKNYYFWEMEETFEYHSAYDIRFYYNGILGPPDEDHPMGLQRTYNPDTLFFCWKSDYLNDRFTYSTEYLTEPVIIDYPLHFIPFTDERLQVKYSLLVKQYTISKNAYIYYKALVEQNSDQDGLITTQPYQIKGNIRNIKDPNEIVLGYFFSAGVRNGPRIFVEAPEPLYKGCIWDTVPWHIERYINTADPSEWPLYFTYMYFENPDDPFGEEIEALALMYKHCLDCTIWGGVAIKPYFWE